MSKDDIDPDSQEYKNAEGKVLKIIDSIYRTVSIRNALKDAGMSSREFSDWLSLVPLWNKKFLIARQFKAQTIADDIIDLSDEYGDPARTRNQIDARKWVASKLKPSEFGDRIDVNVTQTLSISDALIEARKRTLPMRDLEIQANHQMLDSTAVHSDETAGLESVTVEEALAKLPKDPTKF